MRPRCETSSPRPPSRCSRRRSHWYTQRKIGNGGDQVRRFAALILAAGLWLPLAPQALAQTAPLTCANTSGPTVTITDTSYSPATVTVGVDQSVTWVNQGQNVHSAVTDAGMNPSFDTGGLGPGQSACIVFLTTGTFTYHSSIDRVISNNGGVITTRYSLTGSVIVQNSPPAAAAPTAAPAPAASQPCQFVLGFETLAAALPQVGQCRENQHGDGTSSGNQIQHTTGGLLVWRQSDNWTAFTDGYRTWVNGPNGIQERLNTERFPWEHDVVTSPAAAPAAAPAATATPAPTASTNTVQLTDANGFLPNPLTVPAGTAVTFTNEGPSVHSVVSDKGVSPTFDSGGLAAGQSWSYTFNTPGTYTYHSSIDQVNTTDSTTGLTYITYKYTGTITVR